MTLPSLATTGIGGLPHPGADALRLSFEHDVPFLPTPPGVQMVASAVEPDVPAWLSSVAGDFLEAIAERRPAIAKVQLAGPLTVASASGLEVERVRAVLQAKALALVDGVRAAGAKPLIYLDEPALAGDLAPLRSLASALRDRGGWVGVHCCGQPDWNEVLTLPLDVLSFDVRLSLDAIAEAPALEAFLAKGGRLSLGIIPTGPGARYAVPELVDSVLLALPAPAVADALLTPACGLGLFAIADADRVLAELRLAQRLLKEAA